MATPSHVDLSVLWVPIMPETSKLGPEMEKAGQSATESFGKGSEKLGDKITDAVSKSRDKIKDVFSRTGSDASDAMADSIKKNSKNVEDALEDSGKKAGGRFRETISDMLKNGLPEEMSKSGGKLDSIAESLGKKIGATLGTGIGGALGKIDEYAKNVGVDLSGWTGPIKDASGPLSDLQAGAKDIENQIKSVTSNFEGMPGKIGKVAGAIGELAGPLAIVEQAIQRVNDAFDKAGGQRHWDDVVHPNNDPTFPNYDDKPGFWGSFGRLLQSWMPGGTFSNSADKPGPTPGKSSYDGMLLGDHPGGDQASSNFQPGGDPARWGGTIGSGQDAYDFFSSGQPLSLAKPGDGFSWGGDKAPDKPEKPERAPREPAEPRAPRVNVGSIGGASSRSELRRSGGRIAALYELANALQGTPYSQELRNDCSGMVSRLATAALGMEPSVQFTTVNEGDWLMSHGFQSGFGPPGSLRIGWNPQPGNAGHTAATLPGGEHAESGGSHGNFLVGPGAAGADDPQFSMHAWLPMNGKSGGITTPIGSQKDPLFVTQVDENGQVQKSDTQDISQQFGQGFLDGIGQSVGLDGSVFKGFGGASNPKDFGITKLGMGLLNHLLPGNGASPGESISRGVIPMGPGGAQNVRTDPGDTYNFHGPINTGMSVTQNGVQSPTGSLNDMNNSSRTSTATLPNAGTLPSS